MNKGVELINVPRIFYDPSVKTCLLTDVKFDDPTVAYLLANPIRSKIFNFDKFVPNLDVKAFFQDNVQALILQHIVTRDLSLVGNNKLRNLFTKEPKYSKVSAKSGIIFPDISLIFPRFLPYFT